MTVAMLGPLASGKSTLLNYIFGYDCMNNATQYTKGVYGTYF